MTATPEAALREALDRAWLASGDARGVPRPPDLADHLVQEVAALAATPSPALDVKPLLRIAERMSAAAKEHPLRLVEVSQAVFDDTIVRPLREYAALAATPSPDTR